MQVQVQLQLQVQTEVNGLAIVQSVEQIILSDEDFVPGSELSAIFNNDSQINDMLVRAFEDDGQFGDDFNLKSARYPGWRKVGRIIGIIIGIIIKSRLP